MNGLEWLASIQVNKPEMAKPKARCSWGALGDIDNAYDPLQSAKEQIAEKKVDRAISDTTGISLASKKQKLEVVGGAAPLLSVQLVVNYLSTVDAQAHVSYWFGVPRFGAVPCMLILSLRIPS